MAKDAKGITGQVSVRWSPRPPRPSDVGTCAIWWRIVGKRHPGPQPSTRFLRLTATLALLPLAAAGQAFDPGAVLRFNTICAACHEGECSGRLSFSSGPEAAFDHIRRYAGTVGPDIARQLYAILAYMKRQCAYAALPPLPAPSKATREMLEAYREPSTGSYFVSIGVLAVGAQCLVVHLAAPATVRAEVLNEYFEPLVDERTTTRTISLALEFRVEESALHYLRLRSAQAARLDGLELISPCAGEAKPVASNPAPP